MDYGPAVNVVTSEETPLSQAQRPFRFGVVCGAKSFSDWRRLIVDLEQRGYSTAFLSDHLDLSGSHLSTFSPMPALGAAAALSSNLKLGTSVLNQDLRHPAVLAREAHSLQILSSGRFELGLGAGWAEYEYNWAGISFRSNQERLARLDEYVQVVTLLLGPGPVDFEGRYFRISSMPGSESSFGRPPIMIGGYGDRVLALAARRADIVNLNVVGRSDAVPAAIDRKMELLRKEATTELELATMVVMVVVAEGSRRGALEARLQTLHSSGNPVPTANQSFEDILDSPAFLVGSPDHICDQLLERRLRWGFSYYLISYPDMDAFAPVVEKLADS